VRNVDRILRGVAEEGTHDELFAAGGVYAGLHRVHLGLWCEDADWPPCEHHWRSTWSDATAPEHGRCASIRVTPAMAAAGVAMRATGGRLDFSRASVGTGLAVGASMTSPAERRNDPVEASARLSFDRGTLVIEGLDPGAAERLPGVIWDPRVGSYRAPASKHRDIVQGLAQQGHAFVDLVSRQASAFIRSWAAIELRSYQQAALTAWELAGGRGVIVLPTGSGKTRVAVAALARVKKPALCLVPTRVLLWQWVKELGQWHLGTIGCVGDGQRRIEPITVCTFESALRHGARFGAHFGAVVVDEAHHFGAGVQDEALEMLAAGFRLGLTATSPTEPAQAARLAELLGPVVYRLAIDDLAGTYLASYDIVLIEVHLDRDERRRYEREVMAFRTFNRAFRHISPEASWVEFVRAAMRSIAGRQALAAWRESQRIQAFPAGKRRHLGELLARHRGNKVLVFTPNNETAYAVAREHLLMPLTCDINRMERDAALELFRRGALGALVSSRVLNEGLDVPDADVAIIVGGTLGEREHVQRIGRLLRPSPGKRAVVYELVTAGTSETRLANNRRKGLSVPVTRLPAV
jgi:superfamily II DNA or RNA helicase